MRLLQAIERIDLDRLVTATYALDRSEEALTAGWHPPQDLRP